MSDLVTCPACHGKGTLHPFAGHFEPCPTCYGSNEITREESLTCTNCGEVNLDDEACFNHKAMRECVNCCGCEEVSA